MWLATVAWAVGETGMRRSNGSDRAVRLVWTVGVVLALVHAALAFHYVHDWSHTAAALETTRQAEARFGVGWNGGIFVNYAFLTIWTLDACGRWLAPQARAMRWRAIEGLRFAFFIFMFVNGAIVFASGFGRLVGTLCVMAVLVDRARAISAPNPA